MQIDTCELGAGHHQPAGARSAIRQRLASPRTMHQYRRLPLGASPEGLSSRARARQEREKAPPASTRNASALRRPALKQKVIDGPDVLQVIKQIPNLSELVTSLYNCESHRLERQFLRNSSSISSISSFQSLSDLATIESVS